MNRLRAPINQTSEMPAHHRASASAIAGRTADNQIVNGLKSNARLSSSIIQRKQSKDREMPLQRIANFTTSSTAFPAPIQRKCAACEEEEKHVHRKENTAGEIHGSDELDSYVSSLGSSGQALSESSRQFFEPRFGQDFSNVRIHTGSVAAKSAQSINALAYTTGNNIVFNSGQYAPTSEPGRKLLAHELTHVAQQKETQNFVQRFEWSDLLPGYNCLDSLNDEMVSQTLKFREWYYEDKGNQPVPSRVWDAFGHCWIGCEGTKRCGRRSTAFWGKSREFAREYTPYGGPHDSYDQDTNNQTTGRDIGRQDLDCYNGCRDKITTLDLSAPPSELWTPESDSYTDPEVSKQLNENSKQLYENCVREELERPGGIPSQEEVDEAKEKCVSKTGYYSGK